MSLFSIDLEKFICYNLIEEKKSPQFKWYCPKHIRQKFRLSTYNFGRHD